MNLSLSLYTDQNLPKGNYLHFIPTPCLVQRMLLINVCSVPNQIVSCLGRVALPPIHLLFFSYSETRHKIESRVGM